jgi:usherin
MVPEEFQPTVALWWTGPLQPNGEVLYFELYRRQIVTQLGKSNPVLTYDGSSSSFMDSELLPFREYEYQVRNVYYQPFKPRLWAPIRTCP